MKVTKYPQSCLLIEKDGKCLLIDPGSLVTPAYQASDLLPIDGILITHEHSDHIDPTLIRSLLESKKVPIIGNASTAKAFDGLITKVIEDGEEFDLAGFHLKARDLPHCAMVTGDPGPQNTGYVIDGTFFDPGDGISIETVKVDSAAVPIAGPDISPRDIYSFINQIGCKTVIPIHYDYFPADPKFYANLLKNMNSPVKVLVLNNGESTDL
ncbi:MAG TPA: MBL fold metallo-hydrolase [Candidatus Binatia bacterium]|nr:MBL fold metallo-hydrolase [Candidatus Binatia bacterium]